MFTYTKFEAICIALRIHKKKLPAECRQQKCICLYAYIFFTTHKLQRADQRAKNKKVHTLYIHPKPHFQQAAALPTAPPLLSHPANLPTAGRNMTNHHQPLLLSHQNAYPHFAGSRIKHTTQQSQTTSAAKRYTLTQPQAYAYFFAHFSRFLQNGKQEVYIRPQKKKEKNDIKRHKKVLKGIKKG